MGREQVFTIEGATAIPARKVTLAEIGLREREHLQAWVLAHPQILGDDLMIVTEEYDRWAIGSGERDADRLDVLAVDADGRLVVAELKRGKAPDTVLSQMLNYAARVSRFSLDDLAEAYARYRPDVGTPEEALEQLRRHAPDLSDDTLAAGPRCVVLAAEFPPAVTNTALYLLTYGVPVSLLTFDLYTANGGNLLFTTSQLLPVPDTEEFMIRPRSGAETRSAVQMERRQRHGVQAALLEVLGDGQSLTIVAPPGVRKVDTASVQAWLDAEPGRSRAVWCGGEDPRHPVEWGHTGERYTLTGVAQAVVEAATGEAQADVWGPAWLRHNDDGQTLARHAARSRAAAEDAASDTDDVALPA